MNRSPEQFRSGSPLRSAQKAAVCAFTLVELLVVIGIIAMLVGLLLPAMARARVASKIVTAHADLRSITTALLMYRQDHQRRLPPTRFSCSSRTEYELPMELAAGRYLPGEQKTFGLVVRMPDVFRPEETYKYRAPGPAIVNESTLIPDAATIWVPDVFPNCDGTSGRYYSNPSESPVRYAVWSVGPSASSPKFLDTPGRGPVPSRFWCRGAGDTGVITHFQDRQGRMFVSQ